METLSDFTTMELINGSTMAGARGCGLRASLVQFVVLLLMCGNYMCQFRPISLPLARIQARQGNAAGAGGGGANGGGGERPQVQGASAPARPPTSSSGGGSPSQSAPGNSNPASSLFTRIPPLPAPHSGLAAGPPVGLGAFGFPFPPGSPGETVPVGFDEVILILVPQFKIKMRPHHDYWGGDFKYSFPITVFFDKLVIPTGAPPLFLFPLGPLQPVPHKGQPKDKGKEGSHGGGAGGGGGSNHTCPANHRCSSFSRRYSREVGGGRRRRKGVLELPPPETLKGGERATILPKAEKMLENYGFPGRPCLLRAVCEVHGSRLGRSYGLLGEVLTMLFKISKSAYAESHLPEYHRAELQGQKGNCTEYSQKCDFSLFHQHNNQNADGQDEESEDEAADD